MNKVTLSLLTLLLFTTTISPSSFSLVEALKAIKLETNTDQLIASYKIIAQHITELDSIRLTKKFMRLIKTLDETTKNDPDKSIRYKELLRCALSNKAIKRLDLKNELQILLTKYQKLAPKELHSIATIPLQENTTEGLYEEIIIPEIIEEKYIAPITKPIIENPKLKEKQQNSLDGTTQKIDTEHVVNTLLLYDIKKQLHEIRQEIKIIKKECQDLTNQMPSRQQIFAKLLYLEQLIETDKKLTQKSHHLSSFFDSNE